MNAGNICIDMLVFHQLTESGIDFQMRALDQNRVTFQIPEMDDIQSRQRVISLNDHHIWYGKEVLAGKS